MNTENKFNYVLVGGTFNDNKGKESGVVNKLYHALGSFILLFIIYILL